MLGNACLAQVLLGTYLPGNPRESRGQLHPLDGICHGTVRVSNLDVHLYPVEDVEGVLSRRCETTLDDQPRLCFPDFGVAFDSGLHSYLSFVVSDPVWLGPAQGIRPSGRRVFND